MHRNLIEFKRDEKCMQNLVRKPEENIQVNVFWIVISCSVMEGGEETTWEPYV
jgi:hypothetical protein